MATFYLDPVSGADANSGVSWALAWKTVNGGTSARIAAGDTIRVSKTPDPIDTGMTAAWVSGLYQPQYYKSTNNSVNLSASTNATPIVITVNQTHGLTTGEYVMIQGHNTNTNVNGIWQITVLSSTTFSIPATGNGVGSFTGTSYRITSQIVTLSASVSAVISNCENVWTNGTSSVASTGTWGKEGINWSKFTITTPAINTKLAYQTLPSTNFSAYQQVGFWIYAGAAIATGQYTICLCSDTAGATPVNTIAIPAILGPNAWTPINVDTGAALGSAIQSVALYTAGSAPPSNTIYLDHIVACLPSSSPNALNLTSLIGKNNGNEGWFGIRAIQGNLVFLDGGPNATVNGSRGYYGTSETVELWRRETFKQQMMTIQSSSTNSLMSCNSFQKNGNAGTPIIYDGGWNLTTTVRDGDTYWDGQNGYGAMMGGAAFGQIQNVTINRINPCRYWTTFGGYGTFTSFGGLIYNGFNCTCNTGFWSQSAMCGITLNITNITATSGDAIAVSTGGNNTGGINYLNVTNIVSTNGTAIQMSGGGQYVITIGNAVGSANAGIVNVPASSAVTCPVITGVYTTGLQVGGTTNPNINVGAVNNCLGIGFQVNSASGVIAKNMVLSANAVDINLNSNSNPNYLLNSSFSTVTVSGSVDERFYVRNPNGTASAMCYSDNMTCQTDLATVHTAGNRSWKIATSRTSSAYPATLSLGYVTLGGNVINTISAWVRYDTAGMLAGIQVVGNQIEGMTVTQQATSTGTINTWIQVTLTITAATQSGPVMLQAYGLSSSGTQNMWIADISVT